MAKAGLADRLRVATGRSDTLVIDTIAPTTDSIARTTQRLRALGPFCIVGLGGGGALDAAKLIAATLASEHPLEGHALLRRPFPDKSVPTILVPTTAGTGSEVTRTAIFTAHGGRKLWAWGDSLLADLAILDPTLCVDLPVPLTAATGLDALVHAIEACTVKRRTALTSAWSYDAIARIKHALPRALASPHDIDVRAEMQIAACVAGACIENCGTGIAHAMGHALEAVAKLHHGHAVTLSLDAAIGWCARANGDIYAPITRGLQGTASVADALSDFIDEVGLERHVEIAPNLIDTITETTFAAENVPMRANNPRRARRRTVRNFVEQIAGDG